VLRAFYAMQDTRTPAIVNVAATALNIAVNLTFVLALDLGVRGLALGHATSYAFASIVLFLRVRAKVGGLRGERIWSSIGRGALAGLATAGAAWLVAEIFERWLGTSTIGAQTVQLASAVAAGLAVFLASAVALRIEEVDMVRRQIAERWRR
jgi:putative peptidoglycan lipid II flippase